MALVELLVQAEKRGKFIYLYFLNTVFHNIVSSLDYFPSLNSFRTLVRKLFKLSSHNRKLNALWDFQGFKSLKKNSFHGNYLQKYGRLVPCQSSCLRPASVPYLTLVIHCTEIEFFWNYLDSGSTILITLHWSKREVGRLRDYVNDNLRLHEFALIVTCI